LLFPKQIKVAFHDFITRCCLARYIVFYDVISETICPNLISAHSRTNLFFSD